MNYGKGTIIYVARTKYGDNNRYDIRNGHPGMLPIAYDDIMQEAYYLMLTSNVHRYALYEEEYYSLVDVWESIPLKKPSLINLKYIYKSKVDSGKLGGLPPGLYKGVIEKLKRYQEKNPCEHYAEIRDKL